MIKNKDKAVCLILGILAVLSLYFTWCLATIIYRNDIYDVLHLIFSIITNILYLACIKHTRKYITNKSVLFQIKTLNISLLLFWIFITLSDIIGGDNTPLTIVSEIICIISTIVVYSKLAIDIKYIKNKLLSIVKQNYGLLFLLIFSGIVAIYPTMFQFKWDGALYEQAFRVSDVHSMSSCAVFGHISLGYAVLFSFIKAVVLDTRIAMAVLNILMYLGSICAFYGVIKQLVTGKKNLTYLIATSIYAFSPFTLGMVNYYSLDFATLCLFVCMLYFAIKRQWIFHFVAALFAVFTKEPAIVSYGMLCVGIVIKDYVDYKNIKKLFYDFKYYLMLVIGLLWLVTYKMLGGWSGGEGGFALNSNYILNKLKVLYILNFNWIFTVIVIIGIIYILICNRDKIKNITWIMPIVCSTFVFTVFSFLFNTSNHARYSAQVPAVLYIIGTALILYLIREKYAEIILAVLSILLFISSFFTVDPVSKLCFETANVGDMEMLSTGDTVPGDSMIYNKQMLCFEYVLNQAIEEAVNNDYMVIMPMRGGSPNLFDGLMQNKVSQDYGYISETYWSYDTGTRSMYGDGDTLEFNIYELKSTADISQLPLEENEKHVFIYSKLLGEESAQMIMNQYPEAEYREYNAKGWSISVLVF